MAFLKASELSSNSLKKQDTYSLYSHVNAHVLCCLDFREIKLGYDCCSLRLPQKRRQLNFSYLEREVKRCLCHGILVFLEGLTHIVCWGRCETSRQKAKAYWSKRLQEN